MNFPEVLLCAERAICTDHASTGIVSMSGSPGWCQWERSAALNHGDPGYGGHKVCHACTMYLTVGNQTNSVVLLTVVGVVA